MGERDVRGVKPRGATAAACYLSCMIQRIPMTPEGYQKVLAELRDYREVRRPQVIRDLEEARAHGDISENSEYEDAKERQGHVEGRIRELEARVSLAEVLDVRSMTPSDRVVFGTTVQLEDVDSGDRSTYRIVGTEEADPKNGLISYDSPIGRAVLNKRCEDEVRVETPRGSRTFLIVAVQYR
jgi:transcription elongation factor GreA